MSIKTTLFTFCAFTILLSQCKAPIEEKKSRVIVLCDVSNSVVLSKSKSGNIGNLNKLKDYIYEIPQWEQYNLGSEFHFYPINNNFTSVPITDPIVYDIPTESEIPGEVKRVHILKKHACTTIDSLSKADPSSCTLSSIKRAIARFNEYEQMGDTTSYANELILISDMIETCEIKMSLTDSTKFNEAIRGIERDNPGLNALSLDLKVIVLFNSPWMNDKIDPLKKCWREWFQKIGVRPENVSFYTDHPSFPKHNCFKNESKYLVHI